VENFLEKRKKDTPKVENSSKEFLAFVDAFRVFVDQQGETIMQNQETTEFMGYIAKGLGTIGSAPSGGSAKVTIKTRLPKLLRKEGN
jgi:hypothetical protein